MMNNNQLDFVHYSLILNNQNKHLWFQYASFSWKVVINFKWKINTFLETFLSISLFPTEEHWRSHKGLWNLLCILPKCFVALF